jgi:regulator of sigma E protease
MKFSLAPALTDVNGSKKYRIGVATEPAVRIDKLPFPKAFAKSIDQNKRYSVLIMDLVKRMVEQKVSIKTMSGPIGIAKISGEAAQQEGWTPIMMVMAAISLNLGIFNLFPIPILDGGLILLLAIEGLIRRDINQTVKERIYQAAFVCLILFAGLVIFNDVVKLLPHRFQ